MTSTFAVTFDYLCPFARIANEAIVEGVRAGEDWEVTFRPFSLAQTKVKEGEPAVWERAIDGPGTRGVLALQWGIAVRDEFPDDFFDFHVALYDAKHSDGANIGDEAVLRTVAESVGLDPDAVAAVVSGGPPLKTLAAEHTELVERWAVFGVPTFIVGDEAVFARSMQRHRPGDVARIIDMIAWTDLNEFKRTKIPR